MEGTGYEHSDVVSKIYIPGGQSSSGGVYGGVVLLNDLEEHSWSYYSDASPIHRLKPADIKITYKGFGESTMTSTSTANEPDNDDFDADVEDNQVAVNVGEGGNQLIYLKTLENAKEDGTGDYPYTMIPNPFQVRPTYEGTRGGDNGRLRGTNGTTSNRAVYTENFNSVTATVYNGTVNLPDGWTSYRSSTSYAYLPHVSNYSNYPYISNNDGNYLLFTTVRQNNNNYTYWAYAIAPQYPEITSISFKYRYEDTSYGTFTVGYVTNNNNANSYTILQTPTKTESWTTVTLSQSDIATINANGGYLAFRFGSVNNRNVYSAAVDDVVINAAAKNNVNIASGISGGTVVANPTQAFAGATISLTITPTGNNTINSVTVTGNTTGNTITVSGTGNTRTFTMPNEDVTVNASFNNAYNINIASNITGGTVTANPTSAVAGTNVTLTITPYGLNELNTITVTGNSSGNTITLSGTGNTRTFTMPNEDVTVNATFTDPTAKYRGFYAWRVKSMSEGLSIVADGHTYTSDDIEDGIILFADQDIEFVTTKDKGNEVEFEALWAKAYVTNSTSSTSNLVSEVGYERNFIVLNDAEGTSVSNLSVPCTVTAYNPDGTGGSSSSYISGSITCAADLKIENIKIAGNNSTMTANNHDLIIGRGVTANSTYCASDVYGTPNGYSPSSSQDINFIVRIESGSFYNLHLGRGTFSTNVNTLSIKCVLGSDYDRANNKDNEKLTITPGSGTNDGIYGGRQMVVQSQNNKDNLTFDWYVKSGKFNTGDVGYGEGGTESIYIGSSQGNNNLQYIGKRRLVIEGGEMASIAGGMNSGGSNSNYDNDYTTGTAKDVVTIRMKGGTVRGAIYGAAAFAGAKGGRTFVITGGDVLGWIAGGCNGTHTDGGDLYGSSYIYVGGKANVGNSSGGNHVGGVVRYQNSNGGAYYYGANGADGGNIFGAGCGILPGSYSGTWPNGTFTPNTNYQLDSYTVGRVSNSTVVVADNATVWSDVYGGGNYGYIRTNGTSSINVIGGTIKGNVYGGANRQQGQTVNITMKDGEVVNNIYGGSNSWGVVKTAATVSVSGGNVKNVFGGGYGADTDMGTSSSNVNVQVNISGSAEVAQNVYGGGEEGEVYGNTQVNISGGTMQAVFGAGKGTTNQRANIAGNTAVNVSGGEITGKKEGNVTIGSVFGGGERGTVAYNSNNATSDHTSTVSISGGTLNGNVFGGGQLGTTQGKTIVNISGDSQIHGSVFGGAYGTERTVYVAGSHTVNVMATDATHYPYIIGSVYGGSRLANDGKQLGISHDSFDGSSESELNSVINISGGRIREHVYAAGYYGRCFGSVYVNIGADAVENSPYNTDYKASQQGTTFIQGSVWAGGDWGVFEGDFGAPTITGNSNIYVDGAGYTWSNVYTDANYMNLGASIVGCGTSCEAGKGERLLVLRNYGSYTVDEGNSINPVSSTSRQFNSFQRFTDVVIDNSHITFIGQGLVNDLNTTKKYSMYAVEGTATARGYVYLANGSTVIMNAPASNMRHFWSATCANSFKSGLSSSDFTPVEFSELSPNVSNSGYLDGTDNRIRVNGGSYVEVKYDETTGSGQNAVTTTYFGELKGFAHMMVAGTLTNDDATCAYARPKKSTASPVVGSDYENTEDGGFLSYDIQYNTYDANGANATGTNRKQLPYENHAPTRSDTEYFRIWRFGGNQHFVEGVLTVEQKGDASATTTQKYYTVDVTVQLPAWRTSGSYYRFDRVGNAGAMNTLVDYGTDVMTFNAASMAANGANTDLTLGNTWMYFQDGNASATPPTNPTQQTGKASTDCPGINELSANPDVNYGLIIMPGDGMKSHSTTDDNYIICDASDNWIAEDMRYDCDGYNEMPTVKFRLTYRNDIKSNMEWDPITIPLVQCDENGNVKEYVNVSLIINTMTQITSGFETQMYATMNGGRPTPNNRSFVQGKIVLPTFDLEVPNTNSVFTVIKAVYTTQDGEEHAVAIPGQSHTSLTYLPNGNNMDGNSFGLTIQAIQTPDNNDDWRNVPDTPVDGAPGNGNTIQNGLLGDAGGRSALALGFNLWFSNVPSVTEMTWMGTVTFTVEFTNYKYGEGTGVNKKGQFDVAVEIFRIGEGRNFYVDGIYGADNQEVGRGRHPNLAAKTVDYVFNRLGFLPGDNLFVVNTVTIGKAIDWDAAKHLQSNVNIYRYPGNHELAMNTSNEPIPFQGNENNLAFKGVLFNVNKLLSINDINIDGMYAEATATSHNTNIFPIAGIEEEDLFDGEAEAPIFAINSGGRLNLKGNTIVQNNYNGGGETTTANGGAISIAPNGILTMNGFAEIKDNINAVAGGVYMDGSMIVSDYARVFDNKNEVASSKAQRQSNVWLTNGADNDQTDYKVVQIGLVDESGYGKLLKDDENSAKIGIDKSYNNQSHTIDDYLPVVYAETANLTYLEDPYAQPQTLIVHDKNKYDLEKYFVNKNYLYWLSTWVTFQDHQPNNQLPE